MCLSLFCHLRSICFEALSDYYTFTLKFSLVNRWNVNTISENIVSVNNTESVQIYQKHLRLKKGTKQIFLKGIINNINRSSKCVNRNILRQISDLHTRTKALKGITVKIPYLYKEATVYLRFSLSIHPAKTVFILSS